MSWEGGREIPGKRAKAKFGIAILLKNLIVEADFVAPTVLYSVRVEGILPYYW